MKIDGLRRFDFKFVGYGHYRVRYTTPTRGDYWIAIIDNMELIDNTKNAEDVKAKDLDRLRDVVKRKGTHYSCKGKQIS